MAAPAAAPITGPAIQAWLSGPGGGGGGSGEVVASCVISIPIERIKEDWVAYAMKHPGNLSLWQWLLV